MLFSDYLIESVLLEAVGGITNLEVLKETNDNYTARFYVDDHLVEVVVKRGDSDVIHEVFFSVDGEFGIVDVGHAVALIIIRNVIKLTTGYVIKHRSSVDVVHFSSDDTPSRLKLYDRLGNTLKKNGYIDATFYTNYGDKYYVFIDPKYNKYYDIFVKQGTTTSYSSYLKILYDLITISVDIDIDGNGNAVIYIDGDRVKYTETIMTQLITYGLIDIIMPQLSEKSRIINTVKIFQGDDNKRFINYDDIITQVSSLGYKQISSDDPSYISFVKYNR